MVRLSSLRFLFVGLCLTLSACLNSDKKAEALSHNGDDLNNATSSCSIEQIAGGARITCGNSSAVIHDGNVGVNGAVGPQGPQGNVGPQGPQGPAGAPAGAMPRLVEGNGNMVGDYLISTNLTYMNIVWHSASGTTFSYQNGMMLPVSENSMDPGFVHYRSAGCTGQAYTIDLGNQGSIPLLANSAFHTDGRGFKLTDQRESTTVTSTLLFDGTCVTASNYRQNNALPLIRVTEIVLPVPVTLTSPLKIEYR